MIWFGSLINVFMIFGFRIAGISKDFPVFYLQMSINKFTFVYCFDGKSNLAIISLAYELYALLYVGRELPIKLIKSTNVKK